MFKLSEIINNFSDNITNNEILINPIYTAMIIVGLIFIIIYVITYDQIESDTSLIILTVKVGFFSFLGVLTVLFLSFNNIESTIKDKYKSGSYRNTINVVSAPLEDVITPSKY